MDLGNGLGHLSYSTLVHAGDTWPQMRASLEEFVPRVKARVAPDRRFGVSLRLSAASVAELTGRPDERAWLRRFLAEHDLYLYTVNAFPYGPFKGGPVMERVYEPDWATDERVAYTCAVADLLAELAPPTCGRASRPHRWRSRPASPERLRRPVDHRAADGRGAPRGDRGPDRPPGDAGPRARAGLLPGDHRRDRCLLRRADLQPRRHGRARPAGGRAAGRGPRPAAPPPRGRVRHRPPGRRVRGRDQPRSRLVDGRHPGVQAAAGGRALGARAHPGRRPGPAAVHRDDLPEPVRAAAGRAGSHTSSPSAKPSTRTSRTRGRPSCARTSTSRCSSPRSGRSGPPAARSRRRCGCTGRHRCPSTSRSRRTPGTCCRPNIKSGDVVDYVSREIEFVRRALTGPARGSDLQ